jgi:hypothetical protein
VRILVVAFLFTLALTGAEKPDRLRISANQRYFQYPDGRPFFWLGDTDWLLFQNLSREEATRFLDDRQKKGFNVLQVMVLHAANDKNFYGHAAIVDRDPGRPNLDGGADGYWSHAEWIVDQAGALGMYVALVASWGALVKGGELNEKNAAAYGRFLVERFGKRANILWVMGGDIQGSIKPEVWKLLATTIKRLDPGRLMTYHPFGRTDSAQWFHNEPWLDFNMFQSGHRRYDQDTEPGAKGEDNWRYVQEDLARQPLKPTLDGEPSYENLPQGLHDPKEPYWTDADARRYAYWSVFAGAAGHTYGDNSVIQMFKPNTGKGSFGPRNYWWEGMADPGSAQLQHLKNLILSRPYFERVPDQTLLAGAPGVRYDYIAVTRTRGSVMAYTYTGRTIELKLGVLPGREVTAWWYNPRTGEATKLGVFPNSGSKSFTPPAAKQDWVLVVDAVDGKLPAPGQPLPGQL